MDLILILGTFAIFVLLILGILIFILYLLWKIPKVGKILSISLSLLAVYLIYLAIYPSESFYKDEFKNNMDFPLSESAVFINKQASYPDFHGDYYSTATIKITKKEFKKILNKISAKADNTCRTPNSIKNNMQITLEPISCLTIEKEIDKSFELIMFSDQKTIYFLYNQT